jgi:hypothetical protein
MSGTLFHSQEFMTTKYVGGDGRPHYEVRSVDGDSLSLGHTTWGEMKALAEAHGMPRSAWPEYLEYDFGIDVPLEEVYAKQDVFRHYLLRLSPPIVDRHYWLARVVEWVRGGEVIFFCGN